jgi:hypothetical protein
LKVSKAVWVIETGANARKLGMLGFNSKHEALDAYKKCPPDESTKNQTIPVDELNLIEFSDLVYRLVGEAMV